jgi:hypothetical protein
MDKERTEEIKSFLRLIRIRLKPERILLFGSRARGDWLKTSDYDLVIVSNAFEGVRYFDRLTMVYQLKNVPVSVDIICLTPAEFRKEKQRTVTTVVGRALKEGIEIPA